MAKAYKCDCCGEFYESSDIRKIIFRVGDPHHDTEYDLCKECEDSFFVWKRLRNRNNRTAFEDKEDV